MCYGYWVISIGRFIKQIANRTAIIKLAVADTIKFQHVKHPYMYASECAIGIRRSINQIANRTAVTERLLPDDTCIF